MKKNIIFSLFLLLYLVFISQPKAYGLNIQSASTLEHVDICCGDECADEGDCSSSCESACCAIQPVSTTSTVLPSPSYELAVKKEAKAVIWNHDATPFYSSFLSERIHVVHIPTAVVDISPPPISILYCIWRC